jgi:hypothetical protein
LTKKYATALAIVTMAALAVTLSSADGTVASPVFSQPNAVTPLPAPTSTPSPLASRSPAPQDIMEYIHELELQTPPPLVCPSSQNTPVPSDQRFLPGISPVAGTNLHIDPFLEPAANYVRLVIWDKSSVLFSTNNRVAGGQQSNITFSNTDDIRYRVEYCDAPSKSWKTLLPSSQEHHPTRYTDQDPLVREEQSLVYPSVTGSQALSLVSFYWVKPDVALLAQAIKGCPSGGLAGQLLEDAFQIGSVKNEASVSSYIMGHRDQPWPQKELRVEMLYDGHPAQLNGMFPYGHPGAIATDTNSVSVTDHNTALGIDVNSGYLVRGTVTDYDGNVQVITVHSKSC